MFLFKHIKLREKLLISFLLTTTISTVAVTLASIHHFSEMISIEARANMRKYIQVADLVYSNKVKSIQNIAELLSHEEALKILVGLTLKEKTDRYLKEFVQKSSIKNLYIAVINTQQESIGQAHSSGLIIPVDGLSEHTLLHRVLKDGKAVSATESINTNDGKMITIAAASPIFKSAVIRSSAPNRTDDSLSIDSGNEGIVGVVLVHYILNNNSELNQEIQRLLGMTVAIYHDATPIDFRKNSTAINKPYIKQEFYDALLTHVSSYEEVDMQRGAQLAQYRTLYDIDDHPVAVLGVSTPTDKYIQAIDQSVMTFIVIMIVCLICASILGYLLANSILIPIKRLLTGVKRVTHGDLSHEIQIGSNDELGVLAASFNSMAKRLAESFAALEASKQTELAKAYREISALNERLKADNLRMSAELDIAQRLQQMVLPKIKELQQIDGLDIASLMQPADEVGGDYYDVLVHEGRIKIGIGDVTGHGLESGLLMLMVQTAVRTLLNTNITDPVKFLTILNRTIHGNVQRMNLDKSLTLALIDYQQNGELHLSGLHEEMIIIRRGGILERVETIDLGFMLGLADDIEHLVAETTVQLQPGDIVVLYTDGVTEAENLQGKLYGLERLCEIARCHWECSVQEIQQIIIDDVRQHIGQQRVFDDITLLVLKQR